MAQASDYVCPLCNGKKVIKRRGSKQVDDEPASRAHGRGWRTTPCIACVLESYEIDEVLTGLRLARRQRTNEPGVYLVPKVSLGFEYPHPKRGRNR